MTNETRKKVCIVGAGISGLSCAHELIQRGFDVSVYESTDSIGGKAKSEWTADGYPCEHGFRFYGGYKNIFSTFQQIKTGKDSTVFDNLIGVNVNLLFNKLKPIVFYSIHPLVRIFSALKNLYRLCTLTSFSEMYFFCKELVLLSFTKKTYTDQLKNQNFAAYMSHKRKTPEFQRYIERMPQTVWGIPAEKGAAYETMNYLATFFKRYLYGFSSDIFFPIMNAPTSEAVFKPWQVFLQDRGVRFYFNQTLITILPEFDGEKVASLIFQDQNIKNQIIADYFVLSLPVDKVNDLIPNIFQKKLPLIAKLSTSVYALNGIQLYLQGDYTVINGVSRLSDSPWDITASFEDSKLWQTTHLKPPVTAILSTIVANWQAPGILYHKPIYECSPNEIVDELIAQISQHQGICIKRDNVYTFHIDKSIQFSADNSRIVSNTMKHYCVQAGISENEQKATTPINNLFLAGDYVATGMHNGTMESANMSGKIAANEIMKVTGHQDDLCIIFKNSFSE